MQFSNTQNMHINISSDVLFFFFGRIVQPCSFVPISWTRRTSLGSRIPLWCSTEVMRMERKFALVFKSVKNSTENIAHILNHV